MGQAMECAVFLVEDNVDARISYEELLTAHGIRVRAYERAEDCLADVTRFDDGCLVLDQHLPGMSGLQLQAALAAKGIDLPIIFISGVADVPTAVTAMQAGAIDFLQKPTQPDAFVERVRAAILLCEHRRSERARLLELRRGLAELSARQREVLRLAAGGRSNKEIGRALGISHRTVEVHRSRLAERLNAKSPIQLVEAARLLEP